MFEILSAFINLANSLGAAFGSLAGGGIVQIIGFPWGSTMFSGLMIFWIIIYSCFKICSPSKSTGTGDDMVNETKH